MVGREHVMASVGVVLTTGLFFVRRHLSMQRRLYGYIRAASQHSKCDTAVLLVSDLDHTMISHQPVEQATVTFNRVWLEEQVPRGSVLCYNTGRSLEAYLKLARHKPMMMRPDVLICGDGTAIYWFNGDSVHPVQDQEYEEVIRHNFSMKAVKHAFRATEGKTFPMPDDAGENQDVYRHSVIVDNATVATALVEEMSAELRPEHYRLFWCSGREYLNGRYWLAASPRAAGKGNALQFVRHKLGFGTHVTLVAGDSGNDLDMFELTVEKSVEKKADPLATPTTPATKPATPLDMNSTKGPIRGVVVGNAADEVIDFHMSNCDTYRLHAKNHCAAAILEGMAHFGLSTLAKTYL